MHPAAKHAAGMFRFCSTAHVPLTLYTPHWQAWPPARKHCCYHCRHCLLPLPAATATACCHCLLPLPAATACCHCLLLLPLQQAGQSARRGLMQPQPQCHGQGLSTPASRTRTRTRSLVVPRAALNNVHDDPPARRLRCHLNTVFNCTREIRAVGMVRPWHFRPTRFNFPRKSSSKACVRHRISACLFDMIRHVIKPVCFGYDFPQMASLRNRSVAQFL